MRRDCPTLPVDHRSSVLVDLYHSTRNRDKPHAGIDIGARWGSPVRSILPGTVVTVTGNGERGFSGYGKSVVILHRNNIRSLYAHLAETAVTEGQAVEAGQVIGALGSTNGSINNPGSTFFEDKKRGAHLHMEISHKGWPKVYDDGNIDPVVFFRRWGIELEPIRTARRVLYRWKPTERYDECGQPFHHETGGPAGTKTATNNAWAAWLLMGLAISGGTIIARKNI